MFTGNGCNGCYRCNGCDGCHRCDRSDRRHWGNGCDWCYWRKFRLSMATETQYSKSLYLYRPRVTRERPVRPAPRVLQVPRGYVNIFLIAFLIPQCRLLIFFVLTGNGCYRCDGCDGCYWCDGCDRRNRRYWCNWRKSKRCSPSQNMWTHIVVLQPTGDTGATGATGATGVSLDKLLGSCKTCIFILYVYLSRQLGRQERQAPPERPVLRVPLVYVFFDTF